MKISINGKDLEARQGQTVLEVARENGIDIPAVCAHKDLKPYGACRVCLVEITAGGRPGLQASCLFRVTEGLAVRTDTDRVVKARKIMFELLLARSDAPKLKKLAAEWGVTTSRMTKRGNENCILCGLCVRACAEVPQRHAISFGWRGMNRRVQTAYDRVSKTCIGCKSCVHVCPTETIEITSADAP